MTLDERIQHLEAEKRSCMQHFDAAIDNLWNLKHDLEGDSQDEVNKAAESLSPPFHFRPIRIKGKPLSQTIIEDRGNY